MLYARILECLCDPNWLIQNGKCSTKISSFLATAHIHTFPQNAKQKQPKILTVIVHWNTQISFKYGLSYVTYVKWTLETQFSQDLSIGSLYWLETWLNSHQVLMKKKTNKQCWLFILDLSFKNIIISLGKHNSSFTPVTIECFIIILSNFQFRWNKWFIKITFLLSSNIYHKV